MSGGLAIPPPPSAPEAGSLSTAQLDALAAHALATIAGAFGFYIFKRDRRYLRFIWQVVKYTIYLLLGILVFFAFERLVATA